jgi:hypothetical protein
LPTARTWAAGPSAFQPRGTASQPTPLGSPERSTFEAACCLQPSTAAAAHETARASRDTCEQRGSHTPLLGAPGDARELGALAASPGLLPGALWARGVFEGSGSEAGQARQYRCRAAGLWGCAPCQVRLDLTFPRRSFCARVVRAVANGLQGAG